MHLAPKLLSFSIYLSTPGHLGTFAPVIKTGSRENILRERLQEKHSLELIVQESNLNVSGLAGFLHFCNKCHFEIKIAI